MADYGEEGRKGIFNSGVATVERIDALQRASNAARFNMLAWNAETGTFNYEVFVNSQDGLLQEAWSKMSDTEKRDGDRIRKIVHTSMMQCPITSEVKGQIKVFHKNYQKFLIYVNFYERLVRDFLEVHGMGNPNQEDDEGL